MNSEYFLLTKIIKFLTVTFISILCPTSLYLHLETFTFFCFCNIFPCLYIESSEFLRVLLFSLRKGTEEQPEKKRKATCGSQTPHLTLTILKQPTSPLNWPSPVSKKTFKPPKLQYLERKLLLRYINVPYLYLWYYKHWIFSDFKKWDKAFVSYYAENIFLQ